MRRGLKLFTSRSWLNSDGLPSNALLSNTSNSSYAFCFLHLFSSTALLYWWPSRFCRQGKAIQALFCIYMHGTLCCARGAYMLADTEGNAPKTNATSHFSYLVIKFVHTDKRALYTWYNFQRQGKYTTNQARSRFCLGEY